MSKNKTEFQESIEQLKCQISALQKAVKELMESGIKEGVLFKIIQSSSNRYLTGPSYRKKPISLTVIKAVVVQ